MANSIPLLRARRPLPSPVWVETIEGEAFLIATEPWRVPVQGEDYDPLAMRRPRLWEALAELDASDAEACAAFASRWGFLLASTALDVRIGGVDGRKAKTREEYAEGAVYQRERLADWQAALAPLQLAVRLLKAWTQDEWSEVELQIVPVKPPPGWLVLAKDEHSSDALVLPTKPTRERAAQLIYSRLATIGMEQNVTLIDDVDDGPRVMPRSLVGAGWLSLVEDRVHGIRWKSCARCGRASLSLGDDRRSERRVYCGDTCRAAAHKARQRARKKNSKKATRKKASKGRAR